jgi:anti-sigma regulatory factor (Ser/Thr protein kinase)
LATHGSVAEARVAAAQGDVEVSSVSDLLPPIAGAVRQARNMATEVCVRWDLPHLIGPASLVVSELVSNAIEHAGTMMTVRFDRRVRYLHITVRDGSADEPRQKPRTDPPLRGNGLVLVDNMATHWGTLPSRDGKVVWATLATGA